MLRNKIDYFLLILAFISLPLLAFTHPYHISICQINKNEATQNLEITLRIITEDLETSLENTHKKNIFLGDHKEIKEIDNLLSAYFREHLKFKIDNIPINHNYLGKEVEMEITWCYLEIPYSNDFTSISIQNSILIEVNDEEQFNIIRMSFNGKNKSTTLDYNKTETTFEF